MNKSLHSPNPLIKINKNRLINSIYEMAKIGHLPNGGCRRLAFSKEDIAAREIFIKWCQKIDLKVRIDSIGNIFSQLEGKCNEEKPIGVGSHLDTQPHGGKFDGAYGVLAGLEVVRTLKENNILLNKPLELINWSNEEGCRYSPPLMGSSVYTKILHLEKAIKILDKNNISIEEELEKFNFHGVEKKDNIDLAAFLEIHIEQGPILEKQKKSIGTVTGAQGSRGIDVHIEGFDAHSGTTPMRMRKDALLSAANFISIFDAKAREIHSDLRATVGNIIALPGSRNTVSGYSYFTIDIRHSDPKILDLIEKDIYNIGSDLELMYKTKIRINKIYDLPTVNFNSKIINLVQKACEELSYSSLRMISGAGHDAVFLSNKCPTGMIFIPCYNGISHSENEFASENDLENGCNVLLQTILKLDNAEISNY